MMGALIPVRGTCGTFKVINIMYLHILPAGMVYITIWYVHIPRYVLGQNCFEPKLAAVDSDFMSKNEIIECVKQLKLKNCEGYDRIPQRILIDGIDILINPLSQLFSLIYREKLIPEQWLIAKITPIHKKGNKNPLS